MQDLALAGQAFPKVSGRVSAESPKSRKGRSLPSTYADFSLDRLLALHCEEKPESSVSHRGSFDVLKGWCRHQMLALVFVAGSLIL